VTNDLRSRTYLAAHGSFLSVPGAFDAAPEGVVHGLKLEILPVTTRTVEEPGKKAKQTFSTAVRGDRALLDFGAVDPEAIDLSIVERDCELLVQAIRDRPEVLRQALSAVCSESRTKADMSAAATALSDIGLTEQGTLERGGGILVLALAVAAIVLLEGCEHIQHPIAPEPQVPVSPGAPDAGVG
jgi:hypothetical protein